MAKSPPPAPYSMQSLIDIMADLRDPDGGCPWDLQQSFATIAPYTIEEAYEVADAVNRGDVADIRAELGDLLLQAVYHAKIAEDAGLFDFADVVSGICTKMVARHPHVYAVAEASAANADQLPGRWEDMKAAERKTTGALHGVALALPALLRAEKLQKRAARVGFDWPNASGAVEKLAEEVAELAAAADAPQRTEEFGDILFTMVNIARHLNIDAEQALRQANDKFAARFVAMEAMAGADWPATDPARLEQLWDAAKSLDLADQGSASPPSR